MKYKTIVFVVFFCFILTKAHAQSKIKNALVKRERKKGNAISQGKSWLSPVIAPAYTPEHGVVVAGSGLFTFKPQKADSVSQRSSLAVSIYYSSKGNSGVKEYLKFFWFEDRLRINTVLALNDKDNHYHGKGYEMIERTWESDTTTLYHERYYGMDIDFWYRLCPALYAGIKFKPRYTHLSGATDRVNSDPYKSQFKDKYFLNGIGLHVSYDTRDIEVNAWEGLFIDFSALWNARFLGSDYSVNIYQFDSKNYIRLTREGNILAFRLFSRSASGEVPITELLDFEGGRMLTGYIKGEYRDNTTSFFEAEWRYTFKKKDNSLSKSRGILWSGTGYISPNLTKIDRICRIMVLGFVSRSSHV